MMVDYSLHDLLSTLHKHQGSDLHLAVESAPRIRVNGLLKPLALPNLDDQKIGELCRTALTPIQWATLEKQREIDLAYEIPDLARFRVNVFFERGHLGAAFRLLSNKVYTVDELQLPTHLKSLCFLRKGLVLFTGPTGSGKSTSLAALVDFANESRDDHIITIEDPIEYLHGHKRCTVHQRELGTDTYSFANALRSALRQDPDIILLGEMRDPETIQTAITTAETGHLVFSTLHTNGCVQTMTRIVDVFPPESNAQIRNQLALTLAAVVSQALVPGRNGRRHLAMEIMYVTPAIRALIAEGKYNQIYTYLQSGQDQTGMITMNQSLYRLVSEGKIDGGDAFSFSPDQAELNRMIKSHKKVGT